MKGQKLEFGLVVISGKDANAFLQNITTNDITLAGSIYSMMLTAQGKYVADFFITSLGDKFIMEIPLSIKDILLNRLMLYRLRSSVAIKDVSDEYEVIYSHNNITDALVSYRDPRYQGLGYRSITLKSKVCEDELIYTSDKYHYAIPDCGTELISMHSKPLEYGAAELNAISYKKGCYIGQEVISKTTSQKAVKRAVYKIKSELDISNIPIRSDILFNERKIGEFCSGMKNVGIAVLEIESGVDGYLTDRAWLLNHSINIEIPQWRIF